MDKEQLGTDEKEQALLTREAYDFASELRLAGRDQLANEVEREADDDLKLFIGLHLAVM